MAYVNEFFHINEEAEENIRSMIPNFGFNGFGEAVYYRTYSRRRPRNALESRLSETTPEGILQWTGQEKWADTVLRVINGTFSIRKDWYTKNNIEWDEEYWQNYAMGFGNYMFNMYWLPPGRGLWAMGTRFVYERGSMALNNCAFTKLGDNSRLSTDYEWMMDALMMGVGVGFHAERDALRPYIPHGEFIYDIPDTREGWARGTKLLIDAYTIPGRQKPKFRYHLVRPEGLPIRGFGGLSSGPEPLRKLHNQIEQAFNRFLNDTTYDVVQLKTDIANMIGCCVVAGNVRRSAELAMGSIRDQVFMDLKDYEKYPERKPFGYMSNNTAGLDIDDDFDHLGEIARRVPVRGEPGAANWRNFPLGRIGKRNKGLRKDVARGLNPCGEIPLEDKELCNLSETAPTRCDSFATWYKACEYASFYSSTVSLLPTHWSCTNEVVGRNRRIGVGLMDYTGWIKREGLYRVTKALRHGYKVVRATNQWANGGAGVPEAIRVTTIKPGGTVPKLVGVTSGAGYPNFAFMIRRMNVAKNNPIVPILIEANVPYEELLTDPNTLAFKFPLKTNGSKPAERASIWEQANNLVTLSREWADNSVSNTINFRPRWKMVCSRPKWEDIETYIFTTGTEFDALDWDTFTEFYKTQGGNNDKIKLAISEYGDIELYVYDDTHEEDDVEPVLSSIMPVIKACSLLPHTAKGAYRQMPEEGINEEHYNRLLADIRPIDWSAFSGSDGEDERYCQGQSCELPR